MSNSNNELYALIEGWAETEIIVRAYIPLVIKEYRRYVALKVMCPEGDRFRLPSLEYINQGKMPLFVIEGRKAGVSHRKPWELFKGKKEDEGSIVKIMESIHRHWGREIDFWLRSFKNAFPNCTLDSRVEIRTPEDEPHRLVISYVTSR